MTKLPICQNKGTNHYDFTKPSGNFCSRFLSEWTRKEVSSMQLLDQNDATQTHQENKLLYSTVSGVIFFVVCYSVYLWFSRYRLRFLLRFCFAVFSVVLILNISCFFKPFYENMLNEDIDSYCFAKCLTGSTAVITFGSITFFVLVIRFHWSLPLNIRRKLFSFEKRNSKTRLKTAKELTYEKSQLGILKELPPVFPNGWIPILESSDLETNSSKTVTAVGRKFCVFRGSDGKAYVLDAFCPHLGAELAAGGRVLNSCIECPFHEWLFDGKSGQCLRVPYTEKVPDVARIKTWQSCEKNGFIFIWHHAENENPSWVMPLLTDVESRHWKFRGRTEHEVHCHLQEIPENGADLAHLHVIHSKSVFAGQYRFGYLIDFLLNCIEHEWHPCGWESDEERPHVGKIKLNQRMRVCGFSVPFFSLDMNIEQIGPATVHLHLDTCFGRGVFLQHIIPEGPLNHRIIHVLYTESKFKQFPADLLILSEAIMLERDIAVWNNKRFLKNPILVKEDKLINRFRRWYSQFYSEHSPTLRDIKERTLEW